MRRKIDKSALALGEPERIRDERYRRHVTSKACVRCGKEGETQAAHEGYGNYARGMKASDELVFPACWRCHNLHDQDQGSFIWWCQLLSRDEELCMRAVKALLREEYRTWNGNR